MNDKDFPLPEPYIADFDAEQWGVWTAAQMIAHREAYHAAKLDEALKKVPHILRWEQDCTTIEGSMVPNPDGQWAEYWPCAEAIETLLARIKELEAEALALRMKYISAFGQVQENGRE